MILHLIFRLGFWFLLTADLSPANIMIGMAIAFVLPKSKMKFSEIQQPLKSLGKFLVAFPQAYLEAIEIIIFPHTQESLVQEKVTDHRSPLLIFFDIFLITFTPKTIVLKYQEKGSYEVHKINRQETK